MSQSRTAANAPKSACLAVCVVLGSLAVTIGPPANAAAAPSDFTKGPYVQDLAATSAEVRVEVDPPGPVTLDFGEGGPPGRIEHRQAAPFHVFPLTGLLPRTRYVYSAHTGAFAKPGSFTTAPPTDSHDAITFLIYGDTRTDDSAHGAIVRSMVSHPVDFLLNTGDLVEHGGVPGLWQRFFDIEAPILASECVFPTIGNHELVDRDATLYLRYFGPSAALSDAGASSAPSVHRTFRWGLVRVLILGGFGDAANLADEKRWLDEELRKADSEAGLVYRVVMTHHGPWSSGPHGRNSKLVDASIVDVLRAHKVTLMLSGHDHIYERGQAGDIPYIVSGGGGAPSYELKERLPATRMFESARHFVEVHATPIAMTFTALRVDGSRIEECGLPATGTGWDCDKPAGGGAATTAGTGSAPAPNTPGDVKTDTAKSSCACDVVGQGGATGTGAGTAHPLFALFGLFLLRTRRYARRRCAPPWPST